MVSLCWMFEREKCLGFCYELLMNRMTVGPFFRLDVVGFEDSRMVEPGHTKLCYECYETNMEMTKITAKIFFFSQWVPTQTGEKSRGICPGDHCLPNLSLFFVGAVRPG